MQKDGRGPEQWSALVPLEQKNTCSIHEWFVEEPKKPSDGLELYEVSGNEKASRRLRDERFPGYHAFPLYSKHKTFGAFSKSFDPYVSKKNGITFDKIRSMDPFPESVPLRNPDQRWTWRLASRQLENKHRVDVLVLADVLGDAVGIQALVDLFCAKGLKHDLVLHVGDIVETPIGTIERELTSLKAENYRIREETVQAMGSCDDNSRSTRSRRHPLNQVQVDVDDIRNRGLYPLEDSALREAPYRKQLYEDEGLKHYGRTTGMLRLLEGLAPVVLFGPQSCFEHRFANPHWCGCGEDDASKFEQGRAQHLRFECPSSVWIGDGLTPVRSSPLRGDVYDVCSDNDDVNDTDIGDEADEGDAGAGDTHEDDAGAGDTVAGDHGADTDIKKGKSRRVYVADDDYFQHDRRKPYVLRQTPLALYEDLMIFPLPGDRLDRSMLEEGILYDATDPSLRPGKRERASESGKPRSQRRSIVEYYMPVLALQYGAGLGYDPTECLGRERERNIPDMDLHAPEGVKDFSMGNTHRLDSTRGGQCMVLAVRRNPLSPRFERPKFRHVFLPPFQPFYHYLRLSFVFDGTYWDVDWVDKGESVYPTTDSSRLMKAFSMQSNRVSRMFSGRVLPDLQITAPLRMYLDQAFTTDYLWQFLRPYPNTMEYVLISYARYVLYRHMTEGKMLPAVNDAYWKLRDHTTVSTMMKLQAAAHYKVYGHHHPLECMTWDPQFCEEWEKQDKHFQAERVVCNREDDLMEQDPVVHCEDDDDDDLYETADDMED
eukprot:Clim_evm14s158 gene=Clim_evmTU14s158